MSTHDLAVISTSRMATLLSLPDEIILQIIYSLRHCKSTQIYELRTLFATCKKISAIMVLHRKEIVEYYTTIEVNTGETRYKLAGYLHRDNDLPAVISTYEQYVMDRDGSYKFIRNIRYSWYKYGELHRDNGPTNTYINLRRVYVQIWKNDTVTRKAVWVVY